MSSARPGGSAAADQPLANGDAPRSDRNRRVPCPKCGAPIIEGAHKCRACHAWLTPRPRPRAHHRKPRAFTLIAAAVIAVLAVLISQRPSPVGEAPPLTPLSTASAAAKAAGASSDGSNDERPIPSAVAVTAASWRTRQIAVGAHPLDLVFRPDGSAVYVAGDDASIRAFDVATGKELQATIMPAQGDRIRLLHGRYLAVIRHVDASHIPLLDTSDWERKPIVLDVGAEPADVVGLPDERTVVAASAGGKRLSWFDLAEPDGKRLADITLPHTTSQLFVVRSYGRPYVGAMGQQRRAGNPAGAWMDLFDPAEKPFGATRRSIAVGREPRAGAVTSDGAALFFADRVSNTATLLRVDATTEARAVAVGQNPEAAFILGDDRYGITVNSASRTASVVDLAAMKSGRTLMLAGPPRTGAVDAKRRMLVVSLGGTQWPPMGSGVAVIADDPPQVVATLETGRGASRVAVSPDGTHAAVANYWAKALTIIER